MYILLGLVARSNSSCCTLTAAGIAKHGRGQATDDIAAAVELLFTRNLLQGLPFPARVVPNTFRSDRLYNEDVGGRAASAGLPGPCLSSWLLPCRRHQQLPGC
jgi:hypothetical protein